MVLKDKVYKAFNPVVSHEEKSIYFVMNKIAVNLSQEKTSFLNDTYQEELQY